MRTTHPALPSESIRCAPPLSQAEREAAVREMAAAYGCEWKAGVLIDNREDPELMLYSPVDVMRAILLGAVAPCCPCGLAEKPSGQADSTSDERADRDLAESAAASSASPAPTLSAAAPAPKPAASVAGADGAPGPDRRGRHVVEVTTEGFQLLDSETESLCADVWPSRREAEGACAELNERRQAGPGAA